MSAPDESTSQDFPETSVALQPSETSLAMHGDPRRPSGSARLQVAERVYVPADRLARYGRMGCRNWPFWYGDSEEEVLLRDTMMKLNDIGGFNDFGWLQSLKMRLLRATRRCTEIEKRCRLMESSFYAETVRSFTSDDHGLLHESPVHNHQRENDGENESDQLMDYPVDYATLTNAVTCTWQIHPRGSLYNVTDDTVNFVRGCSCAKHGGSACHVSSRQDCFMSDTDSFVPSDGTAFPRMSTYTPLMMDLRPERLDDPERDKERIRYLLYSITRNTSRVNHPSSSSPSDTD
ncbi:hypothetical protein HPB52_001904 [Rhipicephalus sanguineus]|uniref:Uncharacterized protein n=1 Tax=Rhipicephalus sanguineus TaxID=34632 RepID=A0A9D4T8A8_RHISA|nr:hypothetical protein HPB52_001904 [Rhipicephalus sanguineus]